MNQLMTPSRLRSENLAFAGTAGVSPGNRGKGFLPAFCDTESGDVQLSCFRNGSPAPMHLLDGLPETWIKQRSPSGRVAAIKASVIAGFLHGERFYTREQAANSLL